MVTVGVALTASSCRIHPTATATGNDRKSARAFVSPEGSAWPDGQSSVHRNSAPSKDRDRASLPGELAVIAVLIAVLALGIIASGKRQKAKGRAGPSGLRGKRVALWTGILAATVLALTGFAWKTEILKAWYSYRLRSASQGDCWALAEKFETSTAGRAAAEEWYLKVLQDAQVAPRGDPVRIERKQKSLFGDPPYFYFEGEEDIARAADRLAFLKSSQAIPFLLRRLEEDHPELVIISIPRSPGNYALHFTVDSLLRIGGPGISALKGAMKSERENVRLQLLLGNYWMGLENEEAPSLLLIALRDPNPDVISMALWILDEKTNYPFFQKGYPYSDLLIKFKPQLISFLAHPSWKVRQLAASNLGNLGKYAVDAIPALEEALKDPKVRDCADQALREIRQSQRTE